MSWFNPIKGAYPSLQQVDKTLTVSGSGIERGSLIYVTAGKFALAGAAQATDPTAYIFFALNGQTDLVAGMAGSLGQGGKAVDMTTEPPTVSAGAAVVTGLAVGQPFEFETTEFTGTPAVGTLLTVGANGKLVAWTEGDNVVAQVTKAAASRWQNNAVAVANFSTGANVSCLTARTLWIPTFSAVDAT